MDNGTLVTLCDAQGAGDDTVSDPAADSFSRRVFGDAEDEQSGESPGHAEDAPSHLRCAVVTANIGSAGDDPTGDTLQSWVSDVASLLAKEGLDVLCLHMQEVGGKHYTEEWVGKLEAALLEMMQAAPGFGWFSGILNHRLHDKKFTGVAAAIYVSHRALHRVFLGELSKPTEGNPDTTPSSSFVPVAGLTRPTDGTHFHCQKFVDAGKSRKGWVLYDIKVDDREYNHISIHLYHDDDNRITCTCTEGVSEYTERRSAALKEAVSHTSLKNVLIAGDMNFRLDGARLVESVRRSKLSAEVTVGQKVFCWGADQGDVDKLYHDEWTSLRSSCREGCVTRKQVSEELRIDLAELPVSFPPTYPLATSAEAPQGPAHQHSGEGEVAHGIEPGRYSVKRLPAWCDRILFTPTPYQFGLRYSSMETSLDHNMVLLLWSTRDAGAEGDRDAQLDPLTR